MKSEAEALAELMQRPVAERLRIARALLTRIDDEPDDDPDEVAAAWDAEIERRHAEILAGTAETVSLEEFHEHRRKKRAELVAALAKQR